MNTERLLKMAEFLEALPPHKFNFSTYVTVGEKSPAEALAAPEEHCGTTACAVGWLPAIFPKDFKWGRQQFCGYSNIFPRPISDPDEVTSWLHSATAIQDFLGLREDQYEFLFVPDVSPLDDTASAAEVAAQIREFVATDGQIIIEWNNRSNEELDS